MPVWRVIISLVTMVMSASTSPVRQPTRISGSAAMGMGPLARMVRIVLPAALPEILVGCRTGLVLALITMVTSEMITRQTGIGNILFNSLDMAQYDTVYAMIVIIGVLGFALDAAFEALRSRLVGWAAPSHALVEGTT